MTSSTWEAAAMAEERSRKMEKVIESDGPVMEQSLLSGDRSSPPDNREWQVAGERGITT